MTFLMPPRKRKLLIDDKYNQIDKTFEIVFHVGIGYTTNFLQTFFWEDTEDDLKCNDTPFIYILNI